MSERINPRRRILKGLQKVIDKGLSREEALEFILEGLPREYCAKWTSLFYGCLRSYYYLVPWIEEVRLNSGKSKKLPRELHLILVMAAHQYRLMSSFPSYAVIQESLKLVPRRYLSLRKYIGFLLREIERSKIPIPYNTKLPEWLIKKVPSVLGEDFSEELSQRLPEEPSSFFYSTNVLSDELKAIGQGIYTFENLNFDQRLALINRGAVFGESMSISMPLRFEGQPKTYLDLCSAPGSKLSVALLAYPKAQIWAIEKDSSRYDSTLRRLQQNPATRKELHRLEFINADALEGMAKIRPESMDFILLDAPCSALGTLLNHPEFLTLKKSQSFDYLSELQFDLISKALPLLKSGGQLIYSVCTFRPEECEMIMKRCSREHKNIHFVHDDSILGETISQCDYGQYSWGSRGKANQLFYFQRILKEE
ncbi:MAG: transcription antitermination factor NusB [Verrucomicrobiota bacterium]|nr:transcription antitermination factor NusB [Verrucomicrobiota bacterium]